MLTTAARPIGFEMLSDPNSDMATSNTAPNRAETFTISPLQPVVQNKTADPRRRLSAGHETLFDRDFDMVRRV